MKAEDRGGEDPEEEEEEEDERKKEEEDGGEGREERKDDEGAGKRVGEPRRAGLSHTEPNLTALTSQDRS